MSAPRPLAPNFIAVAWAERYLAVVGEHGETDVHDLSAKKIVFQKRRWPLFQLHRGLWAGTQNLVHLSSDGKTLHAVGWRGNVQRSGTTEQEWTEVLKPPVEGYGALAVDHVTGAIALALERFPIHAKQESFLLVSRGGKVH